MKIKKKWSKIKDDVYDIEKGGNNMPFTDLRCQESIYMTEHCYYSNSNNEILLLGKACQSRYICYLFFELPPCFCVQNLVEVRLILFKVPQENKKDMSVKNQYARYRVGPLLDFFSIYSCYYGPMCVDEYLTVSFTDEYCYSYVEIDITNIVRAWMQGNIENRGLLLSGNKYAPLISHASNQFKIDAMRPRMRVTYKEYSFCKPLSSVSCTVTVQ